MKKIHWKMVNAAFWIEMALSYFLPFEVTNHFQYQVGFPVAFLTVYDTKLGKNPFLSMHVNPLGLLLDVLVIYWIVFACVKAYRGFKHHHISGFEPEPKRVPVKTEMKDDGCEAENQ